MRRFDVENQKTIFQALSAIVFLLLIFRLFQLQVLEMGRFVKLSAGNSARFIPINAPRGIIYDRKGNVIVANRAVFSVIILPPSVDNLGQTVSYLNRVTGVPKAVILRRIDEKKSRPFEPVLIADNLSPTVVTKLEEDRYKYPGVMVNTRPVRYYPSGNYAVHALGYVSEITEAELRQMPDKGYRIGSVIGKDGVERNYDLYLRGRDGGMEIEVDASGQPVRILRNVEPVAGNDIWLTIDLGLQRAVEKSMRGRYGATVVVDPRTGEILAMASYPAFNPNAFSEPLSPWEWNRLLSQRGQPFMNRAISAYPPGSTFKVVTQSTVLQEGFAHPSDTFYCPGYFRLGNRIAYCWNRKGHGRVTLLEGLVWSCNVVHYELGRRIAAKLGSEYEPNDKGAADVIAKYARAYGLGKKTGVDLPDEAEGTVPDSAWKEQVYDTIWWPGDTINFAIGQGFLQTTPLQMSNLYSLLANEGYAYAPYIVKEVRNRRGETVYAGSPKVRLQLPISGENLSLIKNALHDVVARGTGIATKIKGIPAAGKTGTAEDPPGVAHAWFDCYAPDKNPEIVIVSFVERGEHGDQITAFIARDILQWYKENRLKQKVEE